MQPLEPFDVTLSLCFTPARRARPASHQSAATIWRTSRISAKSLRGGTAAIVDRHASDHLSCFICLVALIEHFSRCTVLLGAETGRGGNQSDPSVMSEVRLLTVRAVAERIRSLTAPCPTIVHPLSLGPLLGDRQASRGVRRAVKAPANAGRGYDAPHDFGGRDLHGVVTGGAGFIGSNVARRSSRWSAGYCLRHAVRPGASETWSGCRQPAPRRPCASC